MSLNICQRPVRLAIFFVVLTLPVLSPIPIFGESTLSQDELHLLATLEGRGKNRAEMEKLLLDLNSPDASTRSNAVQLLWAAAGDASLQRIIQMMDDPDAGVLFSAARSILETDTPEGNQVIGRSLKSESTLPSYKAQVVALLGERQDERFLSEMGALLSNKNASLRRTVLEALRAIGSSRAFPFYMTATTDADSKVAVAAVQCLEQLGNPAALPRVAMLLKSPDERLRAEAARAIPALGGTGKYQSQLLALSRGKSIMIIQNLANGLISAPSPEGLKILRVLASRPDPLSRKLAVRALKANGSPEADAVLAKLLEDPTPGIRAAAIQALGERNTSSLEEKIIGSAKDPDPSVRIAVAVSLGRFRTHNGLQTLSTMIHDPEPAVRTVVATAAGRIGTPETFPLLEVAAKDTDLYVRSEAIRSLAILRTEPALSLMRNMLGDGEMQVQITAINELGRLKDAGSLEVLKKMQGDDREAVRRAARTAIHLIQGGRKNVGGSS